MRVKGSWAATTILGVAIAFVTLGPAIDRPQTGHPTLERGGAYALLGLAISFGLPRKPALAVAAILASAFGLEALQLLTLDRHARVADALVKALGGLSGLVAGYMVQRVGQRNARRTSCWRR